MKLTLPKLVRAPAPIRIGVFLVVLLLLWVPIAVPLYQVIEDSNTVSIVTLVILYAEFLLLVNFWGRWVYRQPNLLQRYGLEFSYRMGLEVLAGLALGIASLFALFAVQRVFGWVIWQPPSIAFWRLVVEGLLVSLGIGFAEELFFRGWLLDELQRDYRPQVVLWVNATIFALVHGLRPQFPALLLLGLTLVLAKRACGDVGGRLPSSSQPAPQHNLPANSFRGRLGLPMGLHAGLVWSYYIVNVGKLVEYAPHVPEWLTGFDRNPLAGAIGVLFLGILAFGMILYAERRVKTTLL
ncbi:CPBP family intramembrane metalloprotease [Leptolyngbya sp. FACHB-321]|uniref:CPBP family intramembrane glutamic endopeptidase n=1 Tax=Leptolyngbya sp. FACHB-321 TaxID=2692807 RepID=UPI0016871ACA|nr:CPBP family intramembrane metalloprotease [Leptolyngbya sp. FACHB-321]